MNFDTSKPNVGNTDRMIRAIVGVLLLLLAWHHHSFFWALIALILLVTAYLRFCPAYTLGDIDTTKGDAAK
jgi:hypothetical protein